MDDQKKPANELAPEEEEELREGQALYEMVQSSGGWKIINRWLEDVGFHSWMDPREAPSKEEWEWRELNAFHASNNARELLERIAKAISQSEYLAKVKSGEITKRRMTI